MWTDVAYLVNENEGCNFLSWIQELEPVKNKYRISLCLAFMVSGCTSQINHCVYGMPTNVVEIYASVCGKSKVQYVRGPDHWTPSLSLVSNCDGGVTLHVKFDDQSASSYDAIYVDGILDREITVHQLISTGQENQISILDTVRLNALTGCPRLEKLEFEYDPN